MNIDSFPFTTIEWKSVPKQEHTGEMGKAFWQTYMMNSIRVRRVEYSAGYKADHWCSKGHVLFCIEGEMSTELKDGRVFRLAEGMCYLVGDDNEPHRSYTEKGCVLYIVD